MRRTALIGSLALAAAFPAVIAVCQVLPGELAPLFQGVDENGRLVDMADFVDGTPLVFLYTSAT